MIQQKVRKKNACRKESERKVKLGCPMYSKQTNKTLSLKSLIMLSVRLELVYMQYNISDSQALF